VNVDLHFSSQDELVFKARQKGLATVSRGELASEALADFGFSILD
jgi:hypothetical protein